MVVWALDIRGVSEAWYGVLALAKAAGALAGSQTAAPLARRIGRGATLWVAVVTAGVAALAAAAATSPYVAGAAIAGLGWTNLAFNVVNVSVRQRLTPAALLGRVTGIYRAGTVGLMVVGSLAGGAVAALGGLRLPWLLFGIATLTAAVLVFRGLANPVVDRALADADQGP